MLFFIQLNHMRISRFENCALADFYQCSYPDMFLMGSHRRWRIKSWKNGIFAWIWCYFLRILFIDSYQCS